MDSYDPVRVLMASDFYPPFIGGAERQVQLLSKELVGRGYEVHVATVWHKGLPEDEDDEGVSVHRLKALATRVPWFSKDPKRRFHPPFPDPGMIVGLRRLIGRIRPDIVHAHGWVAYSCAPALLRSDIPLVLSVRDYGYTCAKRTMLYRGAACAGPALAKCLRCATEPYGPAKAIAAVAGVFSGKALLLSKAMATHSITSYVREVTQRDLIGGGARGQKPGEDTIPDFVIPSFLAPPPHDAQLSSDWLPSEPYILFVGALQSHKGIHALLSAYESLEDRPPLVLVGTRWPETPARFPDGVLVRQDVPHDQVMTAFDRCLFAVVPSIWPEPLGVVSLEAMSRGKAVVASAVGGITDIVVHEETGLLVPPGDTTALAAAMRRVLSDPALRERLGRGGRERINTFTADAIIPRFQEI